MKDKKLLEEFYILFKTHDDEEFAFLKYPNVNKYKYVISNYGRLFSFVNVKEKKTHRDKDGYLMASVSVENKKGAATVGMHRLVASTFCKKDNEDHNIVNHLDGDKTNNYYKNLEWTTAKGNTQHAIMTGLQINSGPNCPSAVYSEKTVRKICEMLQDKKDVSEIYKYFFPDHDTIIDRAFYALIFSIKSKKRHTSISKEYNIPDEIVSKQKTKFTEEDVQKIKKLLKLGYRPIEIIHVFGEKNSRTVGGRRIMDKIRHIRAQSKKE